MTHFDEDHLGVTGDDGQLHEFALQVGAIYELGTPDENSSYEVAHSASIFLIDPQARVYAEFSPPHPPADIAGQFASKRQRYNQRL